MDDFTGNSATKLKHFTLSDDIEPYLSNWIHTIEYLQEIELLIIGQPPYSPDLAPCDFFITLD